MITIVAGVYVAVKFKDPLFFGIAALLGQSELMLEILTIYYGVLL